MKKNINMEVFNLQELKQKMKKKNIKNLSKIKNAANCPQSNFSALFILLNSTGEMVFIQDIWDSGQKQIKEKKINYDNKCEYVETDELLPYFNYNGNKYYLNEFIRNNFGCDING